METNVIALEMEMNHENFDAAGEASTKVKQVLQRIGIKPEITRRIAIGCYEAEMNVIIHANRGTMKALVYTDRTEIYVEDKGPGIQDINLAMKEGYSTAPDYIREMGFGAGMGLPNMRRCSDKFEIHSAAGIGTKIFMLFKH